MRLRTRLNLVVAALSAAFVTALIAAEVQSARFRCVKRSRQRIAWPPSCSGRLAAVYSAIGGPGSGAQFVHRLGRVRANEVSSYRRPEKSCIARRRRQGRPRGAGLVCAPSAPIGEKVSSARWRTAWSSKRSRRARCSMPGTTSEGFSSWPLSCSVVVNGLAFWSGDHALGAYFQSSRTASGTHAAGRPCIPAATARGFRSARDRRRLQPYGASGRGQGAGGA